MKISKKYKPLFDIHLVEEKLKQSNLKNREYWEALSEVTTFVVTGGRFTGKTFTVGLSVADATVNHEHRCLFTRYTMKSAEKSVIPAYLNRVEALDYLPYVKATRDSVVCTHNRGRVDFAGFKNSAGNQTANLKSLEDYSILVLEEFEEFTNWDDVEKVILSIRDKKTIIIIVMNPATKNHIAWQQFFQSRGVPAGFNGIKDDVCYIHTTYLDLGEDIISPKIWKQYEASRKIYEEVEAIPKEERTKRCSQNDIRIWKFYKYTVLGGWKEEADGLVYENWTMFDEWPEDEDVRIFGLDWGHKPDPTVLVEVRLKGKDMYVKEHIRQNEILNTDLAALIKTVIGDEEEYIVADTNPQQIAEMAALGVYMMKVNKHYGGSKPDKMRGIRKIQDKNLHIHKDSTELHRELRNYHTIVVTNSKGETKPHVVDKDDHGLDAMLYAGTRYQV